jgi:hypothetical protein
MNKIFASIYELGGVLRIGKAGTFSNAIYDNNLYQVLGIISIFAVSAIFIFYYYWPINHPRFNKNIHWFLYFFLICLMFSIFMGLFLHNDMASIKPKPPLFPFNDYLIFCLCNWFFSFLITAILLPLLFKRWSRNCSITPNFLTYKKIF